MHNNQNESRNKEDFLTEEARQKIKNGIQFVSEIDAKKQINNTKKAFKWSLAKLVKTHEKIDKKIEISTVSSLDTEFDWEEIKPLDEEAIWLKPQPSISDAREQISVYFDNNINYLERKAKANFIERYNLEYKKIENKEYAFPILGMFIFIVLFCIIGFSLFSGLSIFLFVSLLISLGVYLWLLIKKSNDNFLQKKKEKLVELEKYKECGSEIIKKRFASHRSVTECLIDNITKQDLEKLDQVGAESVGENQPEVLKVINLNTIPDFDEILGLIEKSVIVGTDGKTRYTPHAIIKFSFSDKQICAFEGAIDITTGQLAYSKIRTFFYQDIVTVNRTQNTMSVQKINRTEAIKNTENEKQDQTKNNASEEEFHIRTTKDIFKIDLVNADTIEIILRDTRLSGNQKIETQEQSVPDETLALLSKLVRDFKEKMLHSNPQGPGHSGAF